MHVQTTNLSPHQVAARIAELRAMSQDPDIYDKLTASIAPSIWEMDDVKRGILCQLFGGTSKVALAASSPACFCQLQQHQPGVPGMSTALHEQRRICQCCSTV